ncbi:aminotransferase-like domain-containing protein [Sulfurospirillum sp. 1612]|uniref:aminotransferase-like domain-containing protein n=1 Tax=Sulfurospirillum sp. 1612 TaxID=3094835 RepID=UPI002F94458A
MNIRFANRVTSAPRSFTRKILDLTKDTSVISFAGGLPDVTLFPHELIKSELDHILQADNKTIYQYSPASGVVELREELAKGYQNSNAEEILLTNGSQQGLDLICKAFINEGDAIVVESPSYLAALNLFALYNPDIIEVKLSANGVDTEQLEEIFKTKKPKFFYAIPTFQNPTGWSWDQKTREEVARLAKKYDIIIIQDGPYDALRYEGENPIGFDTLLPEQTVNLGTFSKTLVPDFRIGWMRANKDLISVFKGLKESTDLQSSKVFQYVAANILKKGKLPAHIAKIKATYKTKRDTMVKALNEHFGSIIDLEIPQGGMFLWIKFPDDIDTMKMFDAAVKENVAYVPGSVFFRDQGISSYARLNYTNATLDEIKTGIKSLKKAYQTYTSK